MRSSECAVGSPPDPPSSSLVLSAKRRNVRPIGGAGVGKHFMFFALIAVLTLFNTPERFGAKVGVFALPARRPSDPRKRSRVNRILEPAHDQSELFLPPVGPRFLGRFNMGAIPDACVPRSALFSDRTSSSGDRAWNMCPQFANVSTSPLGDGDDDEAVHIFVFIAGSGFIDSTYADILTLRAASDACRLPEQLFVHFVTDKTNTVVYEAWTRAFSEDNPSRTRVCGVMHSFEHACSATRMKVDVVALAEPEGPPSDRLSAVLQARCKSDVANLHSYMRSDMARLIDPPPKRVIVSEKAWHPRFQMFSLITDQFKWFQWPQIVGIFTHWQESVFTVDSFSLKPIESVLLDRFSFEACTCVQSSNLPANIFRNCTAGEQPMLLLNFDESLHGGNASMHESLMEYSAILNFIWGRNVSETRWGEFIGALWRASPSLFYSAGARVYGDLWVIPRSHSRPSSEPQPPSDPIDGIDVGADGNNAGAREWRSALGSFVDSSILMIQFTNDVAHLTDGLKYDHVSTSSIRSQQLYIEDIVPSLDNSSDPKILIADNGLFGLCAAARLSEYGYSNFAWLQRNHEAPSALLPEDLIRLGDRNTWIDGRTQFDEESASAALWWDRKLSDSPIDSSLMSAFVRPISKSGGHSDVEYVFDRILDRIVPQSDWDNDFFEELIWVPDNSSDCGPRDVWTKYYRKMFALTMDVDVALYAPALPTGIPTIENKCLVLRNQIKRTSKYRPNYLWRNLYDSIDPARILHHNPDIAVRGINASDRSVLLGHDDARLQSVPYDVLLRSGHVERLADVILESSSESVEHNAEYKLSKLKLRRRHFQRTEHSVSFLVEASTPAKYFYRDIRDENVSLFDAPQYVRLIFPDDDRIFHTVDLDLRPAISESASFFFSSWHKDEEGRIFPSVPFYRLTARVSSALGRVHVPEEEGALREAVLQSLRGVGLFPNEGAMSDYIVYNYSIIREVLVNSALSENPHSSSSLQDDVNAALLSHGIMFDTSESSISQLDPRFAETSCTAGIRSVDRLMVSRRRSQHTLTLEGEQVDDRVDSEGMENPSLANCSKETIKVRSFDDHCELRMDKKRALSTFRFESNPNRVYSLEGALPSSILVTSSTARARFLARTAHLSCRRIGSRSRYEDLVDAAQRDMTNAIAEDEVGVSSFVGFGSNRSLWSRFEVQLYEVAERHEVNCSLPSNKLHADGVDWIRRGGFDRSWDIFSNPLDLRRANSIDSTTDAVAAFHPSTAALLSHLKYIADNYATLPDFLFLSESQLPSDYWFLGVAPKDRDATDERVTSYDALLKSGMLSLQLDKGSRLVAYGDVFVDIELETLPFEQEMSLVFQSGESAYHNDAIAANIISNWLAKCESLASSRTGDLSIFCTAKPFYIVVSSELIRALPQEYWQAMASAATSAVLDSEVGSHRERANLSGGLTLSLLIEISRLLVQINCVATNTDCVSNVEKFALYPLLLEATRYDHALDAVSKVFDVPTIPFISPLTSEEDARYLRESRLSVYIYSLPPSMNRMWVDVVNRILCWLDRTWETNPCTAAVSPTRSQWPVQSVTCGNDREGDNANRTVNSCHVNPLPEQTLEQLKTSFHLTTFRSTDASGDVIALMRLMLSLNHFTIVSDPARADLFLTPIPASFVSFMGRNLNSKPKLCDGMLHIPILLIFYSYQYFCTFLIL